MSYGRKKPANERLRRKTKNRAKLDATMNQIKRDAVKQQTLKSQEPVKISKGRVNEPHLRVDRGI